MLEEKKKQKLGTCIIPGNAALIPGSMAWWLNRREKVAPVLPGVMTELRLEECMMCNGLINMLSLHPGWNWHVYRNYPFLRRGSERVRRLYQFSKLTISGARTIVRWYENKLNETEYPWINFKRFVIALSNEGIDDLKIMRILNYVGGYIENEKVNTLLEHHKWLVPYKLE